MRGFGHRFRAAVRIKLGENDGDVKVESKVATTGSEPAKTTTEMKGDMSGMHLLGVKSVKALIALAKSKPGEINVGNAGIG